MSQESYSSWCYGRPIGSENKRWSSEQELESKIKIITPVDIWQFGFANGGDANGGDGGNAIGGAAAAAFVESDGEGDAADQASEADQASAADQALEAVQNLAADLTASLDLVLFGEGASAVGGEAAGGNGGNGGTAGAGGTVTNTAVVTTVNVIVISDNELGTTPGLTIGTGNENLDISSDENGTFVNGQKLDENALGDGTKVYIFRNSEVKK